jgi:hypothetical protein
MCFAHFAYAGLLAWYNENGSTRNVKVMTHVDMFIVGHGPSTTHKDVCDINLVGWCIQGRGALTTCPKV